MKLTNRMLAAVIALVACGLASCSREARPATPQQCDLRSEKGGTPAKPAPAAASQPKAAVNPTATAGPKAAPAATQPIATTTTKPRRGFAKAEMTRPARFPHRIWAACDFEAKPIDYGMFGKGETKNLPAYPGNATARAGTPYQTSAAMAGINPVPGPCMGKVNQLYCRYYLKGADQARFQHFSLTSSDNWHINVSGLTQGQWSELTLNFQENARRNNGSDSPFKEGERMDDLKVFVGNKDDGQTCELVLDDIIFFATDPALPEETEPFPHRVMYTAGFDTGIESKGPEKSKFFPGEYQAEAKGPGGSYWTVLKAVSVQGKGQHVLLKLDPPRPAAAANKLRFRYLARGGQPIQAVLHNATQNKDHAASVASPAQDKWAWQYVSFQGLAAGDLIDSIEWSIPAAMLTAQRTPGQDGELYIDEVTLFEPGR